MTALPELTTDLYLAGSWTRGGAGTSTTDDPVGVVAAIVPRNTEAETVTVVL
ncbi:hypothetical protein [Nocardia testacea]|uniref:Aldehyde dehydrogenase family protein n=1 Tax=Nocardia testacea TaxID=248551 RepID=A0ABW7VUM7_9NOCA